MKILIAEDETIIRLDLRSLLEGAGFEVCAEARDGEEAVELARRELPDLAVLDVKMPRLDGIEAARRILDERPIPIVLVTAYGERELVIQVDDDGRGPPVAAPAGDGIAGMRERAAASGGELRAGPLPSGGFRVRARLPIEAAA